MNMLTCPYCNQPYNNYERHICKLDVHFPYERSVLNHDFQIASQEHGNVLEASTLYSELSHPSVNLTSDVINVNGEFAGQVSVLPDQSILHFNPANMNDETACKLPPFQSVFIDSRHQNVNREIPVSLPNQAVAGPSCFQPFISQKNVTQKINLKIQNLTYKTNAHEGVSEIEKPCSSSKNVLTCPECGKQFSTKSKLKRHSVQHMKEKPFVCNICDRGFKEKCALKKHNIIHTEEKPFKCEVCGNVFSRKNNLKSHSLVHSGIKVFKCDTCHRGFAHKHDLNIHKFTHTEEKPHKCEVCGKEFSNIFYLKRHFKVHSL